MSNTHTINSEVLKRAQTWLSDDFDQETRQAVQALIAHDPKTLEEAFHKNLSFGTGGMRGIMGVGTNRLNKYTLGMATQGLANYLKKQDIAGPIRVAITHDVRQNSEPFAKLVADVLTANGIHVLLTEGFRPTPELSFAVRYYQCHAGIVLTASHNPPEYNGYKVYWNDGAQVVPPHDQGIIDEVNHVNVQDIHFVGNDNLLTYLSDELDEAFISASLQASTFNTQGRDSLKIVFTSLHGTSIVLIAHVLKNAGFTDFHLVEEQAEPNGLFPTVQSPNPEEPEALRLALEKAEEIGADIVIGTDPDADRVGIAVRDFEGKMVLLNGNQTNVVLTQYLLEQWENKGRLNGQQFIGSTIVTSDVFFDLAKAYGVTCKAGLTGFKWIGKMIREAEGKEEFIGGGEESFGYMVSDFVRDKDAITTTLLACEIAAFAKHQGSSFYNELAKAYTLTNCYQEHLVSIVKKGLDGVKQIEQMMHQLRNDPLRTIGGHPVCYIDDYQSGTRTDMQTYEVSKLSTPSSNVLIYYTTDGTKVAARPSGTEPKIKFYFSVQKPLVRASDFPRIQEELIAKTQTLICELSLD